MRFNTEFSIRSSYEAGPDGSMQHGNIVRMGLEAGYLVTEALGMSYRWFEEQGFIFIVYGIKTEFVAPTRSTERIRIETWLSQAKRFRGCREIALSSAEDGRTIATIQLDWVFVDRRTLAPARMPPDVMDRLLLDPAQACAGVWSTAGAPIGESHLWQHRVQHREIDGLDHVNTAVYIEWCEQAWCEATGNRPGQIKRHQTVFSKSARYGDAVQVTTQPTDSGAWLQIIRNAVTDELLVTNTLISVRDCESS